ncbi:shikimate dehydrogenase family protein [Antarctobacter heliothermus]|uniref:Shikimate dehydrogenase n=1 Tax=Antarctobacter heliothermus TaxID=74033 RepID=A0A239KY79_9RHOB|nr:hypothetical protein [Antarctobacter heliothermus]SNT23317.1 shikimate dehydrogenase [Antarctobacter heliothermus]
MSTNVPAPALTVSGRTRLVPVIGHPIAQAKSPALLSARACEAGADTLFLPMDIRPDGLRAALIGLRQLENLAGLVVTIPFKPLVLDLVDDATPAARLVGAVNLVKPDAQGRWIGDIMDGNGMVRGLAAAGVNLTGASVQIIGGGGAGAAVAQAIAAAGASEIAIADTVAEKAEILAARLAAAFPEIRIRTGHDGLATAGIVVNASPVGMNGTGGTPFDTDRLHSGQIVAEMVMEPAETPLLAAARRIGCKTVPGLATLEGQAGAIIEFLDLAPAAAPATADPKTKTKMD